MSGGLSGFESPSYIYGFVLAFFLVMSTVIEQILEFVEHRLKRLNRNGLNVALNTVVKEVMMLGFISLFLIAFETHIASICVHRFSHYERWASVSHVSECDVCLANTRGLSDTYKEQHHCPFWEDSGDHHEEDTHVEPDTLEVEHHEEDSHVEPDTSEVEHHEEDTHVEPDTSEVEHHEEDTHVEPDTSEVEHHEEDSHVEPDTSEVEHHEEDSHVEPDTSEVERQEEDSRVAPVRSEIERRGRGLLSADGEDTCDGDREPLISATLLHEVHITIFMLTMFHVFNVVLMMILANLKLNRWRRWKMEDDRYALCVDATLNTVTLEPLDSADDVPDGIQIENGTGQRPATIPEDSVPLYNNEANSQQPSAQAGKDELIKKYGSVMKISRKSANVEKPNTVKKAVRWQTEWVFCFFKQFIRPITQKQFRIMRASFMLEHRRSANFDFMAYLTNSLDDDVCLVVKTPAAGWITLIAARILWAPIVYTRWFFTGCAVIYVLFVLVICTKLVTVVRQVTRDERINKLEPKAFWFQNPKLLLPVIRYTLFINSAIFAAMVSLAYHYGTQSCFFYGEQYHGSLYNNSWIIVLALNIVTFAQITLIMLPTYSLVVHMGANHWSHHLISDEVKNRLIELRNRAAKNLASSSREKLSNDGKKFIKGSL